MAARQLMAQVEINSAELRSCGRTPAIEGPIIDCFTRALSAGEPAQVTINTCSDCVIESTFVTVPDGRKFRLYHENDGFGDGRREVRVESCVDIVPAEDTQLSCSAPSTLYACIDPAPRPTSP
ncbi:MAG TPA: hypothetical protein VMG12_25075 [Polyangiaceae bacterium]|nr:hypothetical protein [Polyangiaceae bacterium]